MFYQNPLHQGAFGTSCQIQSLPLIFQWPEVDLLLEEMADVADTCYLGT
jgi:hypothetical protein